MVTEYVEVEKGNTWEYMKKLVLSLIAVLISGSPVFYLFMLETGPGIIFAIVSLINCMVVAGVIDNKLAEIPETKTVVYKIKRRKKR